VNGYRLLVDYEVIEHLNSLPVSKRRQLRDCLLQIWRSPTDLSDYQEKDATGRPVEIHVCNGYAVKYWLDHTDKHVKVLDIYPADRTRN